MKNLISGIFVLFLLTAAAVPVSANTACSAGMIKNSYGLVGQTQIQGMFCAITGIVTFKGDGTANASMKQSCAGMVESVNATATYTVYENCKAVAQAQFSDGDSGTFYFTIVDGGKKLMFMGVEPNVGLTFSGTGEQF